MKFIDLFCGCGGFSRGFVEEGFVPLLSIEIDENAANSYALNYNGVLYEKRYNNLVQKDMYFKLEDFLTSEDIVEFKKLNKYDRLNPVVINDDIRNIHSLNILRKIKEVHDTEEVDLVIGGPPCEAYTGANPKREKNPIDRLYKNEMGRLVLEYIRIVGDLQPKVFVMENVPGILSYEIKESIEKEFKRVGYDDIYFNTLWAEDYGNPSERKRVFVSNVQIKPKKAEKRVYVIEVIEDLEIGKNILNHEGAPLSNRFLKRLHKLRYGSGLVKFKSPCGVLDNYIKLHPHRISETVMGKRRFIHPYEDRLLTVREQARLMGYPDYHIFVGGRESQYNQVGESVPPTLSRVIAKALKPSLL
ncbi:MAG: (cytosine-5)-methyltransferase 1 [Methanothermococcus sp.]|jgi:DNA (cytosine-5)-methyltransferase 1|uniref:DNA cytosine methyltransferase n=1 Tax=Methanothermococcus TaxID=155862 RepID=UPI00037158CE|nr:MULTISPECIES: DNA cytosine methyltransferase [Methanothermococcus]MDK2790799.1 (cytosine-5)-methyltransferase 1 [Methanothermococcus sp.]